MEKCKYVEPEYREVEDGHFCACHLYNSEETNKEIDAKVEELKKGTGVEEK